LGRQFQCDPGRNRIVQYQVAGTIADIRPGKEEADDGDVDDHQRELEADCGRVIAEIEPGEALAEGS